MGKKLLGKTLQAQLIRYSFFIIAVISVFASVCSYITANRKTVEVAKNSLWHHVESISYQYQLAYEEMLNIVLNCAERETFDLDAINGGHTSEARKKALDYAQLVRDYCAITEYGAYISRLAVFDERGNMVQTGSSLGSTEDAEQLLNSEWLRTEAKKPMDYYRLELVASPFFQQKGSILPVVRELGKTRAQARGWAVLCLSTRLFQDVLEDTAVGHETVVVTGDGERIASVDEPEANRERNEQMIGEFLRSDRNRGMEQRRLDGRDCLVAWSTYSRSGITVCEIMPLEELSNDQMIMIQTVAIMCAACLLFGMLLSVMITRQIKKPIDRLVRHIRQVASGDFTKSPEIEGEDEIGQVGRVVNDMAGKMETLLEEQIKNEKEKGDLELKMLQAQINPHFLYNTLDSIRWIAVIQKNSGIVKMVTALSGLLKNMAKGFNEKVTLQKELEFLNDYVTIEKVKYVELFDLDIQVEEEALYQAMVIKLTLQPLVENAIFNGIEPKGRSGTIGIRVFRQNGCLIIKVRDDGVGIPEEKLKNILSNTEKVKGSSMSGIGLPNVDRRIKLNYGEEYGLQIDSQVGVFTEITVKMPLEYERL